MNSTAHAVVARDSTVAPLRAPRGPSSVVSGPLSGDGKQRTTDNGQLTDKVRRVLLCTGKVYYELAKRRADGDLDQVAVAGEEERRQVSVHVEDDGVGFDPSSAAGVGLAGLRNRAREVGGAVDVVSAPGEGTRVTVRVPAR